jgi:hypothetical protein
LLKLRPYKTTVIHALQPRNPASGVNFYSWFLQSAVESEIDLQLTLFPDDASFQFLLLHPVKVGVWCAVSARRIFGPMFFKETINCERYVQVILGQALPELTEDENTMAGFSKTQLLPALYVYLSRALSDVFGDRIISSGIWPARSPDLNPCDFFF